MPAACAGLVVPANIQRYVTRACRLFDAAADAKPRAERRELRQGVRALHHAITAATRAQLKGLAPECAAALTQRYSDAVERVVVLQSQF